MDDFGSTEEAASKRIVGSGDGYSDQDSSNETLIELSKEVIVRVDLFTVVVTFAVLLTLASVGTVANIVVLVVVKYRKRVQAAIRRDAVLCNLSVIHLFICLVLAPIEFATVAENYVKHSLPGFVCLARDCGFHLLVGADVTAVVLLTMFQARRLHQTPSEDPIQSDRCSSSEALPVLQFTLPWIVGACAAAASVSMRLFTSLGFEVCRKSIAFWEQVHREEPWQMELMLGPVYFVVLSGSLVWLVIAVRRSRKNFDKICKQESANSPIANDTPDGSDDKLKKDGDKDKSDSRNIDLKSSSPTSRSNQTRKRSSQVTAIGNQKPSDSQENEDAEEEADDDTFDLKMRNEFEKKSRSSGRRHTVANIGLPDLADLRASSSFGHVDPGTRQSQSGYASKTTEYHYVRKWSVDITALANQLENPKAHSDTSPFKEKEDTDYEEALKGLRAPSNTCVVTSCEYIGPGTSKKTPGNCQETGKSPGSSAIPREITELQSFRENCGTMEKGVGSLRGNPSPRRLEPALRSDVPEASGSGGDAFQETRANPCLLDKTKSMTDSTRGVAKMARELATLSRMVSLVGVVLLLTFPCFAIFVWLSVWPLHNLHLGYNLSLVSEIIMTLDAALGPVLLFWVDRRLRRRLRNLLRDAAHLRCVCYCNIGRHGNCIQANKASVTGRQRAVDGHRPLKT